MPNKTLAAAVAALLALSAMPLVAQPAAAHDQRTQRCDYDPISGQNFNCRSQYVPHSHPKKTTQGPETSSNANPDSSGNLGDDPPDNDDEGDSDGDGDGDGDGGDGTTAPPGCPAGQHSNGGAGRNCHSHSFAPPCGTGTWSPGHGHTPIQRPPCSTTPPDNDTQDDDANRDDEDGDGDRDDGDGGEGGDGKTTETNPCEPWPSCNTSGDPKTTNTTTDACDAWADRTRDALNTLGSDGTPDITPAPDGCSTATREVAGWVRSRGAAFARTVRAQFERAMRQHGDATEAEAEIYRQAAQGIQEIWAALPPEAQSAIKETACIAIAAGAAAVAASANESGIPVPPFWAGVLTEMGCKIGGAYVPDGRPDNGGGSNEGASSAGRPLCASGTFVNGECHVPKGGGDQQGEDDGGGNEQQPEPETPAEPPVTRQDLDDAMNQFRNGGFSQEDWNRYLELDRRYKCQSNPSQC